MEFAIAPYLRIELREIDQFLPSQDDIETKKHNERLDCGLALAKRKESRAEFGEYVPGVPQFSYSVIILSDFARSDCEFPRLWQ
jgi:hypothetical protein